MRFKKLKPERIVGYGSILLLLSFYAFADTSESVDEKLLLSAFTFNVTKFVSWNQRETMKKADAVIHIGVFQNPALLSTLQKITKGKEIDAHPVEVVPLNEKNLNPGSMPEAVVLIPESGNLSRELPKKLRGCKCLLITNGESSDQFGSVINFYSEDSHLRFTIDMERAKTEGLELSSQLLKLGKIL